jgi:hypothetical protein
MPNQANTYEIRAKYVRNTYEIRTKYVRNTYEIRTKYVRNTYEIRTIVECTPWAQASRQSITRIKEQSYQFLPNFMCPWSMRSITHPSHFTHPQSEFWTTTNIIIFYRIMSIHHLHFTKKCTALGPSNLLSYTTCLHQQPPSPISPCTLISDTKTPPLSPPPLPIQRSIWLSLNLPHPPVSHQHHLSSLTLAVNWVSILNRIHN